MVLALGLTRTPPGPLAEAGRASMEMTAQGNEPLGPDKEEILMGVGSSGKGFREDGAEAEQNLASGLPSLMVPPTCC